MAGSSTPVEMACAAVAEAAFGHVSEFRQRANVQQALIDLTRAIADERQSTIDAFEARIAGLEKDSHPPVPLRPIIIEEVRDAMRRNQLRPLG